MLWIEKILLIFINTLLTTMMLFFSLVLSVGIGTLFVYSAITGRFCVKPLDSDPLVDHLVYQIWGLVGIAFILFGLWLTYHFIKSEFF